MVVVRFYNDPSCLIMRAAARGFEALGCLVEWRDLRDFTHSREGCDLVFFHGLRGIRSVVRNAYAGIGVRALVMDLGYLNRPTHQDPLSGYYYLGPNRHGVVPFGQFTSDRYDRLKLPPLGRVDLRDRRKVIILGQVPGDASHGFTTPQLCRHYEDMASDFTEAGFDVYFRPHPLAANTSPALPCLPPSETLGEALLSARGVATLCSNAGLDAIMAGVPAYAKLITTHWYELSSPHLIMPEPARLRAFLNRLAYSQWNLREFEAGLPQAFWLRRLGLGGVQLPAASTS